MCASNFHIFVCVFHTKQLDSFTADHQTLFLLKFMQILLLFCPNQQQQQTATGIWLAVSKEEARQSDATCSDQKNVRMFSLISVNAKQMFGIGRQTTTKGKCNQHLLLMLLLLLFWGRTPTPKIKWKVSLSSWPASLRHKSKDDVVQVNNRCVVLHHDILRVAEMSATAILKLETRVSKDSRAERTTNTSIASFASRSLTIIIYGHSMELESKFMLPESHSTATHVLCAQ